MNKVQISSIAVLLVALLIGCSSGPGSMTISGTIENGAGKTISIQPFDASSPADTATIAADGSYAITIQNPPMDFFKMYVENPDRAIVLAFDSTQGPIQINGDAENFLASYSVTGSPDSELMKDFYLRTEKFKSDSDSIRRLAEQLPPDVDPLIRNAIGQQGQKLQAELEGDLQKMALDNLDSPVALSIISSIDIRNSFDAHKQVAEAMDKVIPNSPYLASMKDRIGQMEGAIAQQKAKEKAMAAIAPGNPAPEIDLQNPDGKYVSLSSMKGKYVLIDFWASWCGPCRRENPNVVKLYDKYGGDNFEILGVSLDGNKDKWIAAIEKDGLQWPHISDLKKWNSQAAADYGVRSIPFTVLVDPEGNIVETKLRGAELEAKLAELFGA